MKRLLLIVVFAVFSTWTFAQEETRVVDSLRSVLSTQEGREKVKTMIELTWEFYDVSYDDCLDWGEKAIKEAQRLSFADLEARATYVLGLQYAYHGDLDLAKSYLRESYNKYIALSDTENAFESLWDIATYELLLGNIDTAYSVYEEALFVAEEDFHYARACIYSNMANIEFKKSNIEKAYSLYDQAKRIFESLEDEKMAVLMEKEMACICSDRGQTDTARKMFWRILSKLEQDKDYCSLCDVNKRLAGLYLNVFVNYDSASYYLQKSLDYSLMPMENQEDVVDANVLRTEALAELADLMMRMGDYMGALKHYTEALALAEEHNYQFGQMQAYVGLIAYYAQMGQASMSLQFYDKYMELEKTTGITTTRPSLRKYIAVDYARLSRFDDLFVELEGFEDENSALLRENGDVYEQNRNLQQYFENLFTQYDSQNEQMQTLQSQRNQYRLAFFGLLAIALFALALLIAYKIVRKKRTKV